MADDDRTLDELRDQAAELDIPGRSTMNKDELADAVDQAADDAAGSQVAVADTGAPAPDPEPTPEQTGRPPLAQVAEQAANREVRVLDASTQED